MKNLFSGVLALGLVATLTACPPAPNPNPRPSPGPTAFGVADFPMRSSEVWAAAWQVADVKPAVAFRLKSAPALNSRGRPTAVLETTGANSKGGIAYIDNSDGTFTVEIDIGTLTFICYAPMTSNWTAGVAGTGQVAFSDNRPNANAQCAMGRSSNTAAGRKWQSGEMRKPEKMLQ